MPTPRPDTAGSLPAVSAAACWLLPFAALAFQLATYRGYGFSGDEFYCLASAEHLGFGYVDHPPLIGLVAWLVRSTLGDSLFAVRLVPALAHAATVALAAREALPLGALPVRAGRRHVV
jgi:4-amino-4-deoxy-L-arabinose transferase-like glycosyltransferase